MGLSSQNDRFAPTETAAKDSLKDEVTLRFQNQLAFTVPETNKLIRQMQNTGDAPPDLQAVHLVQPGGKRGADFTDGYATVAAREESDPKGDREQETAEPVKQSSDNPAGSNDGQEDLTLKKARELLNKLDDDEFGKREEGSRELRDFLKDNLVDGRDSPAMQEILKDKRLEVANRVRRELKDEVDSRWEQATPEEKGKLLGYDHPIITDSFLRATREGKSFVDDMAELGAIAESTGDERLSKVLTNIVDAENVDDKHAFNKTRHELFRESEARLNQAENSFHFQARRLANGVKTNSSFEQDTPALKDMKQADRDKEVDTLIAAATELLATADKERKSVLGALARVLPLSGRNKSRFHKPGMSDIGTGDLLSSTPTRQRLEIAESLAEVAATLGNDPSNRKKLQDLAIQLAKEGLLEPPREHDRAFAKYFDKLVDKLKSPDPDNFSRQVPRAVEERLASRFRAEK